MRLSAPSVMCSRRHAATWHPDVMDAIEALASQTIELGKTNDAFAGWFDELRQIAKLLLRAAGYGR